MKHGIILIGVLIGTFTLQAQQADYLFEQNIEYREGEAQQNCPRCVLDVYAPKHSGFATIVWFHGGGLTSGNKELPEGIKGKGIAVVSPNYSFYPDVKVPGYIDDAAAAVAWVFKNIESFGGDPDKIFISGHSAGGYLASMVGLDISYLQKYGVNANQIAGLIPFSGHTITHFTVRQEYGMPGEQPLIDQYAPLFHVRADAPPLLLITGDREMEMLGRYEENAFMMRMMKVAGHTNTRLMELDGYGHGMVYPAIPILLREVEHVVSMMEK